MQFDIEEAELRSGLKIRRFGFCDILWLWVESHHLCHIRRRILKVRSLCKSNYLDQADNPRFWAQLYDITSMPGAAGYGSALSEL